MFCIFHEEFSGFYNCSIRKKRSIFSIAQDFLGRQAFWRLPKEVPVFAGKATGFLRFCPQKIIL